MGQVKIAVLIKNGDVTLQMETDKADRNDFRALLEQIEILKNKIVFELTKMANIKEVKKDGN